MSGRCGGTPAPGVIEDKIEERRKDSLAPFLGQRRQQDLETFHYPYISLQQQPTSRKEGGGGFSGGWGGREGFITPAGIGVSVPSPGANPSHLLCNLN